MNGQASPYYQKLCLPTPAASEPAWVTVVCKMGCAMQVIQESGWRGLFNGLQASLLGTAVSQGVYFYFYSVLRQLAIARHQRLTRSPSQARREYLQVGQGIQHPPAYL